MRAFLNKFSSFFIFAGLFSFIINMLLLTPSLYMLQVYDRVLGSRSEETLWMLTLILAVALLVMSAMELVRTKLLIKANNAIDAMLAPYLLHKMIIGATSPEGNTYPHGLKDLAAIKGFLTGNGIFAVFDAPWLPVYLLILWLMHPLLLVVAIVGSLLMIILTIANEMVTRNTMASANMAAQLAANFVSAGIRNAEVVNAMGMQKGLTSRWGGLNAKVIELQNVASNRAGIVGGMSKFVRQFLQSVMLGAGAYLVLQSHGFTSGMMIAGTIILGKALAPIEHLIATWKGLLEARTAYDRLDTFIKGLAQELPTMELPPPVGQLSLEKAVFGIRATNKVIIKDVSFALAAGESLGIIGPSAAGKSSLARLITGVWKPLTGTVRLDGADLQAWDKGNLGQYIGYLPQDVELFAGTIADNIARLDTPDAERVIMAAKLAGVHDMILRMPDGYDTQIGVAGAVLSGGQRQRIGLARALFGNPRLVVLDEPNASLDDAGEQALLQAIAYLKQLGATVVLITHKVSLLAGVDKLLVMQDGALAAFGPREAVMNHLVQAQQQAQQQAAQNAQAAQAMGVPVPAATAAAAQGRISDTVPTATTLKADTTEEGSHE
ncbi:MAG TPA: type I secretion system permease/ATPase [Desulfuromonadales bacterium]|nr:type I secretion system permease/ATPase [Desulfuromonadales bacterium]